MCTLFERATRNPCGQDNRISLVTIKLCKVTCNPLASYVCNCVAVVQRPELDTNRSVYSDSDPVTRYPTCGLSGKKLKLSNTQICIGEYP